MSDHAFLTRKDLAERWGVSLSTINNWIVDKKIKQSKTTGMFSAAYIEAIEQAEIDVNTVSAFALRARDRRIEQLENENAMLKSTLYQVAVTANEVAAKLAGQA